MKEIKGRLGAAIIGTMLGGVLLFGYAYLQSANNVLIANLEFILYVFGAVSISVGITLFLLMLEIKIRGEKEGRKYFADVFLWLSYGAFTAFPFYNHEMILIRLVFGILLLVIVVIFTVSLGRAILDTTIAKKRLIIFIGSSILLVFSIVASWIIGKLDFIVFLFPLTLVYSISESMLSINLGKYESEKEKESVTASSQIWHSTKKSFMESFKTSSNLMLVVFILFLLFVKGVWPWPGSLSRLSEISLTAYIVLLGIVTGFSIKEISGSRKESKVVAKPIIGLIQMCIIFIVFSIIGVIIGGEVDISIFKGDNSISGILSSGDVMNNLLSVIQVIILQIVALSFIPLILYIHAMIKGLYSRQSV